MAESMKDYEEQLERSFRKIKEGDVIKGTVIAVSEEEVTLDLNYYTQGIIKAENLSNDPDFEATKEIAIGEEIEATVVALDDGFGNMELSKKEANNILSWEKFQEMMEGDQVLLVRIKEAVNGGVICYVEGIRGFIPASQIATDYVEDLASYVGKQLEVKIITADKEKEKLVLSGKIVAKEKEEEERNHRISMLVPGTILEGTVENITSYGAFVNLGNGLSGLLHISQISHKRLNSVHEVLKEGQNVTVKLLNTNDGKISLTMKDLEEKSEAEETNDVEVESEEALEAAKYSDKEEATTSLGSLFSNLGGFKLHEEGNDK